MIEECYEEELDDDKIEEIYILYKPQLLNYIKLYINTSDSEDILQNFFLRFKELAKTFDPTKGELKTWLFACVKNETLNYLKKRKKKKEIPLNEEEVSKNNLDSSEIKLRFEDLKMILLREEYQLLLFKFIYNFKTAKIKEFMKISTRKFYRLYKSAKNKTKTFYLQII